jgi:hypothetical protein
LRLIGAEVRDQLGLSVVPFLQTVPVPVEGGQGLWGLARTIKAGVCRALKEGDALGAIQEFTYYFTTRNVTQYFNWELVAKVSQTSGS